MAFRTAKQEAGSTAGFRPLPLMQVAGRANRALGQLNNDLRAGGFGHNAQGLARELYASFTATIVATKGTDAEAMAWAIGRALAVDLDRGGFRRGAATLLEGLIEFGTTHADPKILTRLRKTDEDLRRKSGRRWFSSATPPPSPEPERAPPPSRAAPSAAPKAPTAPPAAAAPTPPPAEMPPEPLILTREVPPAAPIVAPAAAAPSVAKPPAPE